MKRDADHVASILVSGVSLPKSTGLLQGSGWKTAALASLGEHGVRPIFNDLWALFSTVAGPFWKSEEKSPVCQELMGWGVLP